MPRRKKRLPFLKFLSEKIPVLMGHPLSVLVHTVFFIGIFLLRFLDISFDQIMLILTTAVSLEAIYLSLFIQMSVNKASESLEDVEKDIDEIQEDVEDITEDIDEVQEDVTEMQKDITGIETDVDDIIVDIKKTDPISPDVKNSAQNLAQFMKKMERDLNSIVSDMKHIKEEINDLKKK